MKGATMKRKLIPALLAALAIAMILILARIMQFPTAGAVDLEQPERISWLVIPAREIQTVSKASQSLDNERKLSMRQARWEAALAVTEEEPEPIYTERELELLAITIYCEAGSDSISDETRRMVGEVVLNRVADERYPDTIAEVLTQRGQYGRFFWTGVVWPARASRSAEAHAVERAYDCARLVFEGERLLPTDTIYQAAHVQGEIVAQVPGFYFCRG